MAAPDIDVDQYRDLAPKVRKLAKGMTLYASSSDRALSVSRKLAGGIPRAGDVFDGKPVLIETVDTIDASAIGTEILGLNHSDYASDRSILHDVKRVFADGKRPPPERGVGLDCMPNDLSPTWWRFSD
ncbi:MAG: alpha/beta hydrolase [Novosphingobium sp.]|nr:alpha/beta hydrolase [Novosphingobium sp.]